MPITSSRPGSSPSRLPTKSHDAVGGKCAALDASRIVCNLSTQRDMMWCPRHNEERVKLYVNYKKYHNALDAFPENTVCRDNDEVMNCCCLDVLVEWNKALLGKYQLLTRSVCLVIT